MTIETRTTAAPLTLVSAAALVVVIYGLQAAQVLLIPFLLSVFFAIIGHRPLSWLRRKGVPSTLAVIMVVIGMMFVVVMITMVLGTSLTAFTLQLPTYQEQLTGRIAGVVENLSERLGTEIDLNWRDSIDPGRIMSLAAGLLTGIKDVFTRAFLIFLAMVFILLETSSFPEKFRAAFGIPMESSEPLGRFLNNMGRYLEIKTVISLATGTLLGTWLWILGVDFPILLGALAFLLNYIPTIGSIIAGIPALLLALLQLGSGAAALVAVGYVAVNVGMGNILEPRIMGRGMGLSPLVVFISLLFWGWVFGPVGMLLSVPLTMSMKIACETSETTRWLAILLGPPEPITPPPPPESEPEGAERPTTV